MDDSLLVHVWGCVFRRVVQAEDFSAPYRLVWLYGSALDLVEVPRDLEDIQVRAVLELQRSMRVL